MNTGLRYILALVVIAGILTVIFSDEHVQQQLSRMTNQITKKVVDLYPNQSCEEPVAYKLGAIDARFGISASEIVDLLEESEQLWEDPSGRDLFAYDPSDEDAVIVNFIFDERQQGIIAARQSEAELTSQWDSFESLTIEYKTVSASYKAQATVYDADVKEYEDLLEDFDKEVDKWNEDGGTQAEYKALKDQEFFIKTVFKGLEAEREELNESAANLNALADKINVIQSQLSRKTDLHNERFAVEEEVNSGDFGSYTINVYQYFSIPDLRLTLAHEMGHAIGIDHVEDDKAIMYYLLETQDVLNLIPTQADIEALSAVCEA